MTKRFSPAPFRIIVPYFLFALFWAFISHYFLNVVAPDWQHFWIDVGDDVLLSVVTGYLLYSLLAREERGRAEARRQVEELALEASRRAEERDAVFDAMADSVLVYDENGVLREANPAAVALVGFDPRGQTLSQLAEKTLLRWPNGQPLTREELPGMRTLRGAPVRNQRLSLTNAAGQRAMLLVSASPLRIDHAAAGAVSVLHDVSEREELLARLAAERARLAAVVEQMPVGVILAEAPSGRTALMNEEVARIFGRPFAPARPGEREVELREPEACLPSPPDDLAQELLEQALASGEPVIGKDVRFKRPDGVCATVSISVVPVREAEGRVAGVLATFHDITERQQVAEALRQARDELRQEAERLELRVQERTASLYETATRLREATEQLASANESLEQRVEDRTRELYREAQRTAALEERQRLARELHDSVSQALYGIALGTHAVIEMLGQPEGKLVETLDYVLTLAQGALTEMRALIFELRPESLERQGLAAALTIQALAVEARYRVAVNIELCDEPVLPLAAKEALYRVAQQALHNIVRHARAHRADVRLCVEPGEVVLEVRDDGVGFDPTVPRPDRLGLRSMRERVERLGGRLEIDSALGRGTLIRAQVPVADEQPADTGN